MTPGSKVDSAVTTLFGIGATLLIMVHRRELSRTTLNYCIDQLTAILELLRSIR